MDPELTGKPERGRKRMLILEGNGHDQEALQKLLQDYGYKVSLRSDDLPNEATSSETAEGDLSLAFMEHFIDGILIADVETVGVKYANGAFAAMLGYSLEEVYRLKVWDWDAVWSREEIEQMYATRNWMGERFETRLRRKDGLLLDVAVCHKPISWRGMEVVLCVIEDISERKKIERVLHLTQFTVDKADDQAYWMTPGGRFLYVNESACAALGYSREELEDMSIWDIDPNVTRENAADYWRQLKEQGSIRFESRHRAKDGSIYPVEIRGNYICFDGKEYSCVFVTDLSERRRTEEAFVKSEHKYRSIVEHAPFGISRSTREGKLLSVNPALASILKFDSVQELMETVNRSSIQDEFFPKPDERALLVDKILTQDSWYVFNNRLRCKDGSMVTCRVHSRRILDANGQASEFESFQENITEQLAAEQALRESEEKFRVLAETSPVAICLYQEDRHIYANPAMESLFGFDAEELCNMKNLDLVHGDCRDLVRERGFARLAGQSVPSQYEVKYLTKAREERHVLISAGMMEYQGCPTVVASFLDITERKRAEELIRASLEEKDVLLREIHHRVKNNLQVVSSLLFLQSQKFNDPELQNCFLESQSRICSMALAHEQLYQSKNLAEISIKGYVENLVGQIQEIFVTPGQAIDCLLAVEDLDLDITKVVPCGLMITELLSNAYKHAFVDGRSGQVTISMKSSTGQIELAVTDNGIGWPDELDYRQPKTLGLQLVKALTNQLNGTLELERSNGTRFRVCFAG